VSFVRTAVLITMQENIQGIPPPCVRDAAIRRRSCNAGANYQMKDVSQRLERLECLVDVF